MLNLNNPDAFYETQLIVLGVVCLISLVVDRYLARKTRALLASSASQPARDAADDRLESGKANGPVGSVSPVSGSAAMRSLERKYLVVYAIVMGEFQRVSWCVDQG